MLEEHYQEGKKVQANWYYKEGEDDIRENGKEFFEDVEMDYTISVY